MTRLVHPGKLEDEIGKSAEETQNCDYHPKPVLAPSPESCHEEDDNCNRDGGHCNPFLGICETRDNDKELDGEGKEEEEIELEESDVDLGGGQWGVLLVCQLESCSLLGKSNSAA